MSAEQQQQLTLNTSFIEQISPLHHLDYSIPSTGTAVETPDDPHSISSTTFNLNSTSFILSRLINNGHTLELRVNAFSQSTSASTSLPPVQFHFPTQLVPNPPFTLLDDPAVLQVYALTVNGYLHTLTFPADTLFYGHLDDEGRGWSEENKLDTLENRTPILLHGVDEGRLLVACEDGFALSVEMEESGGVLQQIELRVGSSFVRSLLPSFSSRASSPTSSPSQVLAFATSPSLTSAFGVTRDRKLKVWNLETGACLRVVDLPRASSSSELELASPSPADTSSPRSKGVTLLPSRPFPILKLISTSATSSTSYQLLMHVPPFSFNTYQVTLSPSNSAIVELIPLAEHAAPAQSSRETLVDFVVPEGEKKILWALWDDRGDAVLRCKRTPELETSEEDEIDVREGWVSIENGSAGIAWSPTYFDELFLRLSSSTPLTPESISDTFIEHIFYPGRYTPSTLSTALTSYIQLLLSELAFPFPLPLTSEADYASTTDHIIATVGCQLHIDQDPNSGKRLLDLHATKLRREWMRFVAIAEEERSEQLSPLALVINGEDVVVLRRDAVSVPVEMDSALLLKHLLSQNATSLASFQSLPPSSLVSSFPLLAPQAIRHDLLLLLPILNSFITNPNSVAIQSLLVGRARAPVTASIEEVALETWEELETLISVDEHEVWIEKIRETLTPEASLQALWTILTVPSAGNNGIQKDAQDKEDLTPLSRALLVNGVSRGLKARYELALGLVGLLVFASGEDEQLVPRLEELISASWATLHSLAGLKWVSGLPGVEPSEKDKEGEEEDVATLMGEMKFGENQDSGKVFSDSLLGSLIAAPRYTPSFDSGLSLSKGLAKAQASFVDRTGLLDQKRQVVAKPADVEFGLYLVKSNPEWAVEWTSWGGGGAGMRYVRGRALLERGEESWDDAAKEMGRAAAGLYDQHTRLDESHGLSLVLPLDVRGSLARYYHHVVQLFAAQGAHNPVAKFTKLAIEEAEKGVEVEEEIRKDCWLKLFRACAEEGRWEEAYSAVMGTPFSDTKSTCLAHLVSVLCQNGQASLLTQWAFVGLQAELERILSFRARNADPLAEPNYARVLYSYHVAKGDFRSAGATMFQYARRIGELAGRASVYRDMATLQCRSYLAAANALSLVNSKHAWVAIIADDARSDRGSKRRKLTYHIPEEEFEGASGAPEVVDVADIRKEYATALARLQLSTDFPELERTNFSLDSESVVALFAQTGAFDAAFAAARTLEVDMSSLFEILAEKCVGLSLNGVSCEDVSWVLLNDEAATWEGDLASKAWRLLQAHLGRHDGLTQQYRLVVLERALAVNRGGKLPTWLVDFFLANDPAALLRTLLRFDRLADAFAFSLTTIKTSAIQNQPLSSNLPYSIFDQLLSIAPNDSPALSAEGLLSRQEQLRGALASRFVTLERAGKAFERALA